MRTSILLLLCPALACCNSGGPPILPLSERPYTTLQAVWEPLLPPAATLAAIDDGSLTEWDHAAFATAGLGVRLGPGQLWQEHTELAPDFAPGQSEQRRSLTYFWLAADPQLIDEESPIRFEAFSVLYRPNGHLSPQVWDAHVQTARRISRACSRPFDFALLAGDLTDGAQQNELAWTLGILEGSDIDPDSGADDDPVPGPGNDFNDPFRAPGLGVPWYAAIGNHDGTYNGGFAAIGDELRLAAQGAAVYEFGVFPNGYCDGADPDATLHTAGPTPADPRRIPQRRGDWLDTIFRAPGEPAGHGLTADDVATGRGYYSAQPLGGRPLRLIALDTLNDQPEGIGQGSAGRIGQDQIEWLAEELNEAHAARELVIALSHHRPEDLSSESPVQAEELRALLGSAEEVVLHLTGHGHANVSRTVLQDDSSGGYWQLMTAAPLDFPLQSRIVELVDEGNGFLSIYTTNLDHNSPPGSLAHQARELAAAKAAFMARTAGRDLAAVWLSDLAAQNLLLRVRLPEPVRARLAEHDWPTRIESEETLTALTGP